MESMVSVIIPVYNRQAYIKECLESVQAQSYDNLEMIIVDDGSTDQTADICRMMANEDRRIRYYEGGHNGVSAARNTALEKASGEYVLFLDSDDIIHPRLLEILVQAMDNSGAQIGGTQCYSVLEQYWGTVKENFIAQKEIDQYEHMEFEQAIKAVFYEKTPLSMIGGVMIRRDLIGDTRFNTELTIGEDFYFIYENLTKGVSAIFLKSFMYLSRLHQKNTSWDYGYTGFMTRLLRRQWVWEKEEQFGRNENARKEKRGIIGIYLRCLSHNRTFSKDCKMMRKTLKKYKKDVFSAMDLKGKLIFISAVYVPFAGVIINRISQIRHRKG